MELRCFQRVNSQGEELTVIDREGADSHLGALQPLQPTARTAAYTDRGGGGGGDRDRLPGSVASM